MSVNPNRPLSDDEMETVSGAGRGTQGQDADGIDTADADGTDAGDADGTDAADADQTDVDSQDADARDQ